MRTESRIFTVVFSCISLCFVTKIEGSSYQDGGGLSGIRGQAGPSSLIANFSFAGYFHHPSGQWTMDD